MLDKNNEFFLGKSYLYGDLIIKPAVDSDKVASSNQKYEKLYYKCLPWSTSNILSFFSEDKKPALLDLYWRTSLMIYGFQV